MITPIRKGWLAIAFVVALALPTSASALLFSSLVIFGDSLSDSGNNAIALPALGLPGTTPVPISGNTFIPTLPYASGVYTNDMVWAQTFASALGLSAAPSLAGGTDFAFAGARTGPIDPALPQVSTFPPSLLTQEAFFLGATGGVAPGSALYVVAGGGNNARDALGAIEANPTPGNISQTIAATAASFAADIVANVSALEGAGAKNIVVWDVPDVGKAPAILADGLGASILGSTLAAAMNTALLGAIGGDSNVKLFDLFGLVDSVVANPGAFGLTNVTDACAQFVNCNPSQYFFWDGIHPTSAGQGILSQAMLRTIPEPATLALLAIALAGLGFSRRRNPH